MDKEQTTGRLTTAQIVKQAAEALTVFAFTSYAVGFVIVTSYMLTYGHSGTALFKVKYISSGLLYLGLLALIAASLYPIFWAQNEERKFNPSSPESRRKAILMGSGIAIYLLWQILNMITDTTVRLDLDVQPWIVGTIVLIFIGATILESSNKDWKLVLWLKKYPGFSYLVYCSGMFLTSYQILPLMCIGLMILSMWLIMNFVLQQAPLSARIQDWPVSVLNEFSVVVVASLLSIGLFSTYMYEHIKPQFGGGLPARVWVVLADEKKNQLAKLGYIQQADNLLADVRLLDSSENEYLIFVKPFSDVKGVLIELDRKMVDGIVYYPSSF